MSNMLTATQLAAIPTIANKAMAVRLTIGSGKARIRDTAAEAAVKQQFGDEGQTVSKAVFKNAACVVYRRMQKANEMRQYFNRNTLPHTDGGWRVLPNTMYLEVSGMLGQYEQELKVMDATILGNYSALVQQDITERNSALAAQGKAANAKAEDYPTFDHMSRLLYVQYYFQPIATENDFRYAVTDADKDRLNGLFEELEENISRSFYDRMMEPIQQFISKLEKYTGDDGQRFSNSFVENINDMLVHLPKLNYNDDPRVTQMLEDVRKTMEPYKFAGVDMLKEDADARKLAQENLKALATKLDGYGF